MATFGVLILIQNVLALGYGAEPQALPRPYADAGLTMAGGPGDGQDIVVMLGGAASVAGTLAAGLLAGIAEAVAGRAIGGRYADIVVYLAAVAPGWMTGEWMEDRLGERCLLSASVMRSCAIAYCAGWPAAAVVSQPSRLDIAWAELTTAHTWPESSAAHHRTDHG